MTNIIVTSILTAKFKLYRQVGENMAASADNRRSTHRYQFLKEHLVTQIRAGVYANGAKVDSEPSLCKDFQLSRNTVRQALQELENEGFLYRIQGKGTFVRSADPHRSSKIALLIYDTVYMTNPVTAALIQGIDAGCREHGLTLDILAGNRTFREEKVSQLTERYAGFLIGAYQLDPLTLKELLASSRPCFFVKNYLPEFRDIALRIDFEAAGAMAAKHLADQGCRDLALLHAGEAISISNDFANGVKQICLEYGIKLKKANILSCDFINPESSAKSAAEKLLADLPDGVICLTDELALALNNELKQHHIMIPEQIKITGCNNSVISLYASPALTTLELPTYDLGVMAAEHLYNAICGKNSEVFTPLQPQLVVRESTCSR